MFTIRPASKNGHKNANGSGHSSNGNGNGHGLLGNGHGHKNGNGAQAGNGHGKQLESVLGPGIHFKGTLTGAGGVRIEGGFDGVITLTGPLVITDGAKVTAEIRASAVSVAGHLKGNITAAKVEILSTGRVWGDLVTTAFATEEGAFLRGQVTMEDEMTPPPPETAAVTQPHIPVGELQEV
ncbi:MAG TPA: polymer-forming cytoskeletal protein [Anaerolineales bacterium]|nr:polymer-forming cytoskeletal protein [Anaerolineales bacterium]